jgi:predicted aldo/keto reductase-like oxidoreductase
MKGTRREFLETSAKLIASGIVGSSLLGKTVQAATKSVTTHPAKEEPKVELRKLGKTDMNISVISIGTIGTSENVVRYALDNGLNFIHTSLHYGKAINEVGKAIKGRKDKFYLGLKVTWNWDSDKELNDCLKTLNRDHVDVIFFQIHNDPNLVASPKTKETFERWKKQGKVRYMGLTSHGGMKECIESAMKVGWYDVLMPSYDLSMREDYRDIFKKVKKLNLGFIAMKTRIAEDKTQSIPVLLSDKEVTTLCKSLTTLSAVKKYIEATKQKVTSEEAGKVVDRETSMLNGRCHMCGACTQACPYSLAVNDIVRSVDYYVDAMRDFDAGRLNYKLISPSANAACCTDCGRCENVCPNRVPIRSLIRRSKEMFV